ncbi:hypothetical protein BPJM79_10277 [Bacillus pumilus]
MFFRIILMTLPILKKNKQEVLDREKKIISLLHRGTDIDVEFRCAKHESGICPR